MIRLTASLCVLALGSGTIATAQDVSWPRFRGTTNTDHSPDTGLLKKWAKGGPKQLWIYSDAGNGYSGFSVRSDRLFTMGTRGDDTFLFCLNAETGKKIWETRVGALLENGWGNGPRSTPTLDGDRVYAISGRGDILCVEQKSGKKVWSHKTRKFGGRIPKWGYSESLLVDGDQVICAPGGRKGALVALNKANGETIWQSTDFTGSAEYSSVVVAEISGKRQYIRLLQKTLAGIDAKDGTVIWSTDWPGRTAVIPTPIVDGNRVYITSGYGVGCMLLEITDEGPKKLWQNKVMKNHHGGVVRVGDHLYGHADAGWVCQKWEDGTEEWRERDALGKGAIHYADGMLYCLEEGSGTVALVEATPKGYKEASRFILKPQSKIRSRRGKVWVHPVVVGGRLFLRDQEHIYCFDVKAKRAKKAKNK
jgi:outer membrane protein assembly factor BamB